MPACSRLASLYNSLMRDKQLRQALRDAKLTLGVELIPCPYDTTPLTDRLNQLETMVGSLARALGYIWEGGGQWKKRSEPKGKRQ